MQGYKTRKLEFEIGAFKGQLRALQDKMQFSDPEGCAARAGICSASWSLFGQLWPASKILARAMKKIELRGQRILELGCGLALPSLALQYRGANITASDYHPVSRDFLHHNTRMNNLSDIPFMRLDWSSPPGGYQFDLIIASDVLYEPAHPKLLAHAIQQLASASCKVLLSCPGRGYKNRFSRKMARLGFELEETPVPFTTDEPPPHKGRLLAYELSR